MTIGSKAKIIMPPDYAYGNLETYYGKDHKVKTEDENVRDITP